MPAVSQGVQVVSCEFSGPSSLVKQVLLFTRSIEVKRQPCFSFSLAPLVASV